jgi:hypothetical protein
MRVILAAGILLAAGIFAFWIITRAPRGQSVTLPDGSTITFAGVSYGKTNCWPPEKSWKRFLAVLPRGIQSRFGYNPGWPVPLETNHAVIWLYVSPAGSSGLWQSGVMFSLVDDQGNQCFLNCVPYAFPPVGKTGGPLRDGIDVSVFPRRSRNFALRLYSLSQYGKLSALGDLAIVNPAYRQYPEWQPAALPLTQTKGNLRITLTRLATGLKQFELQRAGTNMEDWGQAWFSFSKDGKPCNDWQVDTIEFSDATGNRALPSGWGYQEQNGGRGVLNFKSTLWPMEAAWKLKVILKRAADAPFAGNEVWVITNLSMPAIRPPATNLNLAGTVNGVKLQLLSLANEGSQLPANSDMMIRVNFADPNLPSGMRYDILSVTGHDSPNSDDTGHPGQWIGSSGNSYTYILPASTRTLDVKVGVYRQIEAEFMAKPETLPVEK